MREVWRRLWRMTAVRQALATALMFLVVLVVVAMVSFIGLQNALMERVDASLETRLLSLLSSDEDIHEHGEEFDEQILDTARLNDNERYIAVVDQAGRSLLGPPQSDLPQAGFATLPSSNAANDESGYRVLVEPLPAGRLVVAESLEGNAETIAQVARALILGGIVAALASLGGGLLLGLRAQRRIDAIGRGLDAVAEGDLGARLPAGESGDDLDRVALRTNAMLDRLQTLVLSMRDLSANIAHDLKTPITRLHGRLNQLRDTTGEQEVQSGMDGALAEIERIAGTFDAVLRIAQIEAGARRERFTTVRLADIAGEIEGLFASVMEETGRPWRVDIADPTATVSGDRELLLQMTSNLIANAMTHTAADAEVTLRIADRSLIVADRGPGVAEAERSRIFERFYRTDRSRGSGGTGLGLAMVKAIADLHDARIDVLDNAPGLSIGIAFPDPDQ